MHQAVGINLSGQRKVLPTCIKDYGLDGCCFEPNAAFRTVQADYLGELQFALSDPPDKPEAGATIGTIHHTVCGHSWGLSNPGQGNGETSLTGVPPAANGS